jgi:hypothetical protein
MSKLAKASLNDSKIFLDLGAAIEANFQKINVDFSKFSMQTVEMILTFLNPVNRYINFHGSRASSLSLPSPQRSSRFNSTPESRRSTASKQTLGTGSVENSARNYRTATTRLYPSSSQSIRPLGTSGFSVSSWNPYSHSVSHGIRRITPLIAACCRRIGKTVV